VTRGSITSWSGCESFETGTTVGEVARVEHFPAQDLLVVTTEGSEVLLPFVKAFVPEVNIEAGVVEITPPGGLFESIPDES
jgi:16S rRNA processing protein RimM